MPSFDFRTVPHIHAGTGSASQLARIAAPLIGDRDRILIITDKGVRSFGLLDGAVAGLEAAGFAVESCKDATEANIAFGKRSKEMLDRGEKPPHRGVHLIHGAATAKNATANTAKAIRNGAVIPIEVLCRNGG